MGAEEEHVHLSHYLTINKGICHHLQPESCLTMSFSQKPVKCVLMVLTLRNMGFRVFVNFLKTAQKNRLMCRYIFF